MTSSRPVSPFTSAQMDAIRRRFMHVDADPVSGPRIFLENGGGSLVLKSVAERYFELMAYPDSSRRANQSSAFLLGTVDKGLSALRDILGMTSGGLVIGMTGTEVLFRLVRTILTNSKGGSAAVAALEHASSHDAVKYWADKTGHRFLEVALDANSGTVSSEEYARTIRPDTIVATLVHTSHVTGKVLDVNGIVAAIRSVAPECIIICDGIQHAPHGSISVHDYGVDAYVFSPYKAFAGRGYSIGWVAERFGGVPHEKLEGKASSVWDLGSRNPAIYGSMCALHEYLCWLGEELGETRTARSQILAAMDAVNRHELSLIDLAINGDDTVAGLHDIAGVRILGGKDLAGREGAVSFAIDGVKAADIVAELGRRRIRVHSRSGEGDSSAKYVMKAYGMEACVRASLAHCNTVSEIRALLSAVAAECLR